MKRFLILAALGLVVGLLSQAEAGNRGFFRNHQSGHFSHHYGYNYYGFNNCGYGYGFYQPPVVVAPPVVTMQPVPIQPPPNPANPDPPADSQPSPPPGGPPESHPLAAPADSDVGKLVQDLLKQGKAVEIQVSPDGKTTVRVVPK